MEGADARLERIAAECRRAGIALAAEAADERSLARVAEHADLLVVGGAAMHDVPLLREAGRSEMPVLVTRGMAATVEELLLAAEVVLAAGKPRVVLCEGGVRGFDPGRRSVLDLTAIPVVRALSHLPVLADPSAAGEAVGTEALARAAVAAGADGVLLDVQVDFRHGEPPRLRSASRGFEEAMAGMRAAVNAASRDDGGRWGRNASRACPGTFDMDARRPPAVDRGPPLSSHVRRSLWRDADQAPVISDPFSATAPPLPVRVLPL